MTFGPVGRRRAASGWLSGCVAWLCVCAALLLAGGQVEARNDPRIGRAEKVVQDVRALMPEMERRLVVNEDVFRNDTIETKHASAARLVFRDETYLSIGPASRVRLANLPVAQDDGKPFVVDAAQGVFKFVSGRLRSERYRIKTPAATIGVRGTIVWMTVRADGLTEVAAQTGEVTVCAQGACVTLRPGEYSRAEAGRAPSPPADVPADFYARIRDMLIRLLMASEDGLGLDFGGIGGAAGLGVPGPANGGRQGSRAFPGPRGPGLASRGTGPFAAQRPSALQADQPDAQGGQPDAPSGQPGGPVRIDGPATAGLLLVGLLAFALLARRQDRLAAAGRRRG